MSESEPRDSEEWEAYADMKYEEFKKIIKDIENKGTSRNVEENIRDASKSFGDMLVSLSALTYNITSKVTQKTPIEDVAAIQQDLVDKTGKARNIIADELDRVSKHLRSEESSDN